MIERAPDAGSAGVEGLRRIGRAMLSLPRSVAWIVPAALALWIFLLSALEGSGRPPRWWDLGGLTGNLAHPLLFGLLALTAVPLAPRGIGPSGRPWVALSPVFVLWLFVAVVLYGFTDELHQSTVDGRDASLLDLVSDAVGAGCVLWIVVYLGTEAASSAGLGRRLAVAAVASVVAAGAATLWGNGVGPGPWPF